MLRRRKRILVCSPVRKGPEVVREFLWGLKNLRAWNCRIDFHFIDDNFNPESSSLLKRFSRPGSRVFLEPAEDRICVHEVEEFSHIWTLETVNRVVRFKNHQIRFALKHGYDYVLFVDADVIVHPDTLFWLLSARKDIISEVYWTKWSPEVNYMPQVWMYDNYSYCRSNAKDPKETLKRTIDVLEQLRRPGVYSVGGLGALTLISRRVLKAGVDFSGLYNISWPGEDRHFCIKAVAAGFKLYADTHAPAFHIYREEDLNYVKYYKRYLSEYPDWIFFPPKRLIHPQRDSVVLMMPVRNEASKCLERVLEAVKPLIDGAVIWDDCSTDSTPNIVQNALGDTPLKLIRPEHRIENEKLRREALWKETVKVNPGFILALDADEVPVGLGEELEKIKRIWRADLWCFRLYDMWDEEHYREDEFWNAHRRHHPFLFRYQPLSEYTFVDKPLHMGRFPKQVFDFPVGLGKTKILHYGYSKTEWREEKYRKYKELDPDARWGIRQQYESILDPNPTLKPIKGAE